MGYAAEYPIPVFFNVSVGFMGGENSLTKSADIIAFFSGGVGELGDRGVVEVESRSRTAVVFCFFRLVEVGS